MKTKMVIVVRKDLNMRKGKMIAQGAHAVEQLVVEIMDRKYQTRTKPHCPEIVAFDHWQESGRKKIALSVDSEADLLEVYQKAVEASIPAALVTDAGHTEFKGVPTKTAVAIGPAEESVVDEVTGKLRLL